MRKSSVILAASLFAMGAAFPCSVSLLPQARAQESTAAVARRIGAIKTIQGNTITLTPDSGPDVSVTVQPNARILRIAPGAKDLKDATAVQIQDLQVGDRIRVRGQAGDQNQIAALEVIVMARTDLDAHRQQEQQDWQKRGTGGLVSSVEPATGTVTVSVTGFGGKKEIAVHTTKNTVFRRYAPDSVKFDDAKPSTLAEIRPGDQLRARGDRAPDGSEVTAQEVVTGSFRNVAGTVNSIDANAGTVNVQDLLSKKAVVVKITPESQLHKLPPEFAQRIAMRLKGSMPPGTPGAAANGSNAQQGSQGAAKPPTEAPGRVGPAGGNGGGMGAGMRSGAGSDFQQILSRMPVVTLADLHKGDALLIVATEGSSSGDSTAITLLSGVEPILQAAPSREAMMLTPWSLGGAPPGDAAQ
jgi:co-chaperonin GroES (HSP10)